MKRKFLAAKVNINGNIFNQNVKELILEIPTAIKSNHILKSRKSSWAWQFADVLEFNHENKQLLSGNFVKARREFRTVVEDGKTKQYEIPYQVAYPSFFIYDPVSEVLVFEETGDIQRNHFIDAFERIIFEANVTIGKIEVKLIPRKEELYKRIMEIEILTKIEFDLIHPNFYYKEEYEDLSEIIKREKATRMKTSLENEKGLNKEGFIIKNGIEMVGQGYGEVKASGFNNVPSRRKGKSKRKVMGFKSRDSIEMTHVEKNLSEKDFKNTMGTFLNKIINILV
ncbi:MAG: hypothetical protein LPK00_11870 [Bacillaceae bacterium]|nr:hypothetical protein [Bacillaceae bacterium]